MCYPVAYDRGQQCTTMFCSRHLRNHSDRAQEGYSMAKLYTGKRTKTGVEVSVKIIDLRNRTRECPLRHIPFHSPDGFECGYGGSGPADLALAILVDALRERPPTKGWLAGEQCSRWTVHSQAFRHHQDFKRTFVATFEETWEFSEV
jgi:hypothetical protein